MIATTSSGRARERPASTGTSSANGTAGTAVSAGSNPAVEPGTPASTRIAGSRPSSTNAASDRSPKNSVSATVASRPGPAAGSRAAGARSGPATPRRAGNHGSAARSATGAHTAIPALHPPRAPATGTLTAAGSATPAEMLIAYTPVIRPTRSGNQRRTSGGPSTFAAAIPLSETALPARNTVGPQAAARVATPAPTSRNAPAMTRSASNRRASGGAANPSAAKHSVGSAVRTPAVTRYQPNRNAGHRGAFRSAATGV